MSWGKALAGLPLAAAIRSRASSVLASGGSFLIPSGIALTLLALATVGGTIWQLRASTLEEAKRDISNLALVLGEQAARSVQAIDLVIRNLHDDVVEMNIERPEALGEILGTEAIHSLFKNRLMRLPQAESIALIDAAGKGVNVARTWPPPPIDVSDRDYYQHFKAQDDPNAFISAPLKNKISGIWSVVLARRINARDGHFLGIILAVVNIEYFEKIFSSINLPRQEAFTLLRRDGTIVVRHPDKIQRAGQMIPAGSPWFALVAGGGGRFTSAGLLDGVSRIVAVRPLKEYPLVVDVAVAEGAVLADWRREALFIGFGTFAVVAFALYLVWRIRIQFGRLSRQNRDLTDLSEELTRSQAHLHEKSQALETTLATMDQGLMMINEEGIVVIINKRATELLDLPADWMATRPSFVEVLKYQWQANGSGREEGSFDDFIRARTVLNRPHTQELRRPNGRVLEVRSIPLREGGAVRTYTDITARKIAEERAHYVARHDGLTRLVNRRVFNERLQEATMLAAINQKELAVLYLDLDRFKQVNDTRGHEAGDRLLVEAGRRMESVTRSTDTVARIGGDEFAVIVPVLDSPESVAHLAERLIGALGKPFMIDEEVALIGASIGISLFPEHGATVDALLHQADEALYEAKHCGRNTYRFGKAEKPAPVLAAAN
jgi:diguanylate cyclase (GGDEF)-like protein